MLIALIRSMHMIAKIRERYIVLSLVLPNTMDKEEIQNKESSIFFSLSVMHSLQKSVSVPSKLFVNNEICERKNRLCSAFCLRPPSLKVAEGMHVCPVVSCSDNYLWWQLITEILIFNTFSRHKNGARTSFKTWKYLRILPHQSSVLPILCT